MNLVCQTYSNIQLTYQAQLQLAQTAHIEKL